VAGGAARFRLDIEESLQNLTSEGSENQSPDQGSLQATGAFPRPS